MAVNLIDKLFFYDSHSQGLGIKNYDFNVWFLKDTFKARFEFEFLCCLKMPGFRKLPNHITLKRCQTSKLVKLTDYLLGLLR